MSGKSALASPPRALPLRSNLHPDQPTDRFPSFPLLLDWWQNWRLPYYNMAAAGDTDMLATMFQWFQSTLPLAKLRTKAYAASANAAATGFNISTASGAAFWPEYTSMFGTTHSQSYGCNRAADAKAASEPAWYSEDRWNHFNVQGALDAVMLMLDHHAHTQDDAAFVTHGGMAVASVEFFRQRWQTNGLDSSGHIIIYPTQAVETDQCPGWPVDKGDCCTNDMPTVAGLRAVLPRLLALPAALLAQLGADGAMVAAWRTFAAQLPPLPTAADGTLLSCAAAPNHTANVENPELYAVHPFRSLSRGNLPASYLGPARLAFGDAKFPADTGWNQMAMDAALLGLAGKARDLVLARARTPPAAGYRFPAFMPHEQDYPPSSDHLAVFSNALTYMLMQSSTSPDDAEAGVVLLPAWPCAWDVAFKLHAPQQTVITGELANGTLTFNVQPPARRAAVTVAACQPK